MEGKKGKRDGGEEGAGRWDTISAASTWSTGPLWRAMERNLVGGGDLISISAKVRSCFNSRKNTNIVCRLLTLLLLYSSDANLRR